MRTTIIDVKFDEESKSEHRIGLPCKEKPENAENCRKIINFWRLIDVLKPASVLVITGFLFSGFFEFPAFY